MKSVDDLAFISGHIEGKAHRQGFDPEGREKLAQRAGASKPAHPC